MKKLFSIVLKSLLVMLMVFSNLSHIVAEDKDPHDKTEDVQIEVSVVEPEGQYPVTVTHWTDVKFKASFMVNPHHTEQVSGGDYIIIDWPTQDNAALTPHDNRVELWDGDDLYGVAYITESGGKIVFENIVSEKYDIVGSVEISGRITKSDVSSNKTEEFKININGEATTIFNVEPGDSVIGGDKDIRKYGEQVTEEGYDGILTWNIRINEDFENNFVDDLTLVDNLQKGHQLLEEGIFLQVFEKKDDKVVTVLDFYNTLSDSNKTLLKNIIENLDKTDDEKYTFEDVEMLPIAFVYSLEEEGVGYWVNDAAAYFVFQNFDLENYNPLTIDDYLGEGNFKFTNKKLEMTIPQDIINGKFLQLVYYTIITDFSLETYKNSAEMTFKKSIPSNEHAEDSKEVKYNSSSGEITGLDFNTLKVTKVDSKGRIIPGIYFRVTRKSDEKFERIIVTDENGVCELFKLPADEYYVKEMTEEEAKQIDPNVFYPKNIVIDGETHVVTIGSDKSGTKDNDLTIINDMVAYSSLEIIKYLEGDDVDPEEYFEFDIILSDKTVNGTYNEVEFVEGQARFLMKGNNSILIEGLPADISYEVYEVEGEKYYEVTFENNIGQLVADETSTVIFTNTANKDNTKGGFVLRKTVSGDADPNKKYKFVVTATINGDELFKDEISLSTNEIVSYTDLEEGTIVTVKELESGYDTTYTVDGKNTTTVTIVKDMNITMIVNNHKKPKTPDIPKTGID